MYKKTPLSPHQTIKDDLLLWTKKYLVHKLRTLFKDSKTNTINDITILEHRLLDAQDIKSVKEVCNEAIRNNLKSLIKVLSGSIRFYTFITEHTSNIKSIDNQTILNFKDTMDLADGTIKNYIDVATELVTFIEKNNSDKYLFNITNEIIRTKKQHKKVRDALSSSDFRMFNREIEEYPYRDETTKARDILVIRFILLCGLKASDVIELELNKDLVYTKKDLYLQLSSRKERFNLPRKHFVKQLDKYIALEQKSHKGAFFYDLSNKNKKLTLKYIQELIKELLSFAKIQIREPSAEVLRTSLAVYLYNYRTEGKQITLNTIQELLGLERVSKVKEMIGFHDNTSFTVTDVFKD